MPSNDVSAEDLLAACKELLTNPSYRERAQARQDRRSPPLGMLARLGSALGGSKAGPRRVVELPPECGQPAGARRVVLELPPGNEAHMHKTETVDYVIMLEGEVVGGDRRGRELGFPTANIPLPKGTALP